MSDVKKWSSTDNNNSAVPPAGFPEHMPPSMVNDSARAIMGAVRRMYLELPYFNPGGTIRYIDGNTFAINDTNEVTDFGQYYTEGRRLKFKSPQGVKYGNVGTVTYSGTETQVKVAIDGGAEMDADTTDALCGLDPDDTGEVVGRLPVGMLLNYTADGTPPPGMLFADGKSFDPLIYKGLAKIYKTGENTYKYGQELVAGVYWPKTPDVRGYFPRWADLGAGVDKDRETGSKQEDALPNLKGTAQYLGYRDNPQVTGVFEHTQSGGVNHYGSSHTYGGNMLGFDASLSNEVYGRDDTEEVRVKNIAFPALIVAWHGVTPAENITMQDLLLAFNQMQEALDAIYIAKTEAIDEIKIAGQDTINQNIQYIEETAQEAVELVDSTTSSAVTTVTNAANQAVNTVNQTTSEAVETINTTKDNAITEVQGVADEIVATGDQQVTRVEEAGDEAAQVAQDAANAAAASAGATNIPLLSPLAQLRELEGDDAVGWAKQGSVLNRATYAMENGHGLTNLIDKAINEGADFTDKFSGSHFGLTNTGSTILGNQATDFSARGYIAAGMTTNMFAAANNYSFSGRFKTGASVAGTQRFIGGENSNGASPYNAPLVPGVNNGKFTLYASSTGAGWNLANALNGTYTVLPNTDYWYKMSFTGTAYTFQYSLDNVSNVEDVTNWVTDITLASTTKVFNSTGLYIYGNHFYTTSNVDRYWQGVIYYDTMKLTVNGVVVWRSWAEISGKVRKGLKVVDVAEQSKVDDLFNIIGVAPYIINDTSTNMMTLPRTLYPFTYTQDANDINRYVQDQIQNMTGVAQPISSNGSSASKMNLDGVFYKNPTGGNNEATWTGAATVSDCTIRFNSARSVRAGDETRQRSSTGFLYFKVGNSIVGQDTIDVSTLTTQVDDLETRVTDVENVGLFKFWESGLYDISGTDSTVFSINHNLNLQRPQEAMFQLVGLSKVAYNDYATGDIITRWDWADGTNFPGSVQQAVIKSNTIETITMGNFYPRKKTGGQGGTISSATYLRLKIRIWYKE